MARASPLSLLSTQRCAGGRLSLLVWTPRCFKSRMFAVSLGAEQSESIIALPLRFHVHFKIVCFQRNTVCMLTGIVFSLQITALTHPAAFYFLNFSATVCVCCTFSLEFFLLKFFLLFCKYYHHPNLIFLFVSCFHSCWCIQMQFILYVDFVVFNLTEFTYKF